jgi:acetoacetyl-CoA reductase/3-oxoacyl-[acyl-carrier protein] reductase
MGTLRADFAGEIVLVTGGASGIGRVLSLALAEAGARVHVLDLPREPPLELPSAATFHAADVRFADRVEQAVADVLTSEGRIDHCVIAAGTTADRTLAKLSDEEWDRVLDTNLGGAFHVLRVVARHMRERGRGHIVTIASINALRGKIGQANYCASKAGLVALTRAAARELGARGITVNAVLPGMIDTPMSARLPEEVIEQARAETCLGRLGRPEDVVSAILYLLSDEAAHVTGATLVVDGGQTA